MDSNTLMILSSNVISAIAIIMLNKILLNYWPFPWTLSVFHALVTWFGIYLVHRFDFVKHASISFIHVSISAMAGLLSISMMNLNLQINSVGVYQSSKLLVIPLTALLEFLLLGTRFGLDSIFYLCCMLTGVVLSLPDEYFNSLKGRITIEGIAVASAASLISSLSIIIIGYIQTTNSVKPLTLLYSQQPFAVMYSVSLSLFFEKPRDAWLLSNFMTSILLVVTGLLAISINFTGFILISALSPLSFQIVTLLKSLGVSVMGSFLFHESMLSQQWYGVILASLSMLMFSLSKSQNIYFESLKRSNLIHQRFLSALTCGFIIGLYLISRTVVAVPKYIHNQSQARDNFIPKNPPWNVMACTQVRQDAHVIQEWILWNLAAGVDHFVLYDNSDISPGGLKDNLDEAISSFPHGLITLHRYHKDVMNNLSLASEYGQNKTDYETLHLEFDNPIKHRCYETYHTKARWIALIDADEVFVPMKENLDLSTFLIHSNETNAQNVGGVGFFWRISHYSGYFFRPENNKLSSFKLCDKHSANRHIKTIVRGMSDTDTPVVRAVNNAHYMDYNPPWKCITENFDSTSKGCEVSDLHDPGFNPLSIHFQLNHYFSRSVEEFITKSFRGMHFMKSHDSLRIYEFAEHSNCYPVDDLNTLRAAKKVEELRTKLSIPEFTMNVSIPEIRVEYVNNELLSLMYQAVKQKKHWDDEYYLLQAQNRSECQPKPPDDSLLHFWGTGHSAGCLYRFIDRKN
jgi:drug/metabolite transporter (DMT)-like permease